MLNELNNFVYENHLGQRFDGMSNGMYLNHSNILDYKWDYDVINRRISRFYRPVTTVKLPIVVIGKTEEEAITAKNRLLEIAEADIQATMPGKIYVGDYYSSGFITSSKKSKYLYNKRYCNISFEFTSVDHAWFIDHALSFSKDDYNSSGNYGVDYPYDYPFDYSASVKNRQIVVDSIGSNKFKLRIFGDAINPSINISGHQYSVIGTIKKGESLFIDSINKTITLTTASGSKINWFDKRSRESYIFEPIKSGIANIRYDGSFAFDLTIVEERSEPKWI